MNLLDSLKRYTTVVADTGDFETIAEYKPQDATTNPSLLYQAAQKPQYQHLVDDALKYAIHSPGDRAARTEAFMDRLLVNFGCENSTPTPASSSSMSGRRNCHASSRRKSSTNFGAVSATA